MRGLRGISDFKYQSKLALTNRKIGVDIEIFFNTKRRIFFKSYSMVKEIAKLGREVHPLLEKEII